MSGGLYVEPRRAKPYGAILTPAAPPKPATPPPAATAGNPLLLAEWENFEARLEHTYRDHGHHPELTVTRSTWVNPEGDVWRQVYRTLRGTGNTSHETATRAIESEIDRIEGRPDRWRSPGPGPVTPPPPAGSFRRIEGVLRQVGRHFHDDRGYLSPRGASCLYGLADGVDASALLAQYAAEGVQYVRVFAGELPRVVNGSDRGFQQTAVDARTRLPNLLAAANVRGLRVQVCMVTDSALVDYDVYQHAAICAQLVAGTGHWLEGGNEVEDGEQRHDIDWRRIVRVCRDAGYTGLFTVGAALSDELLQPGDRYPLGEVGDFASTHPWRGHEPHWMGDVCRLREGEMIAAELGIPIAFGEPDQIDRQPIGYALALGAFGAGFNAAVVCHSTEGRDARPLTGDNLAKLRAFVRGHALLEAGPWEFRNAQRPGNWANSPIVAGAFEEGDPSPHLLPGGHLWRAFSFVRDGHGFTIPIGRAPQDPGAFRIGNGWVEGAEVERSTGVRILEVRS